MDNRRKIILFELNEVPWRVVNYYCELFPESTLAKVCAASFNYETVNTDSGHLSPWITWPTFHRGVNNTKHQIADLNQDLSRINKEYPPIWEILQHHGVKTAVFGSMHSAPAPADYKNYVFYVPDPFSAEKTASPSYIEPFQAFSLAMSRESARNVSRKIDMKTGVKVMLKWPQLGFKTGTFAKIGKQLLDERKRPWVKARRRSYQVVLAWDVFMKQLKATRPEFVTFFSNHVASTMHRYWAATFPGDYTNFNIDKNWVETYKHEIAFTMGIFDEFLTELKAYVDQNREYKLVIASSMGQASTNARMCETQLYVKNEKKFFSELGLGQQDYTHVPCMFPQFNITVKADKINGFKAELAGLHIDGSPLKYREAENGFFSLDLGHANLKEEKLLFKGQERSFADMGLENVEIEDKSATTAYHIPQGIMMVYDPRDTSPKGARQTVNSTAFAPSILKAFNVPVPAYMEYVPLAGLQERQMAASA